MVVATGRERVVPHQGGAAVRAPTATADPRTVAAVQGALSLLADGGRAPAADHAPAVVEVPRVGEGRDVVVLVVVLEDRSDPGGSAAAIAAACAAAMAAAATVGDAPAPGAASSGGDAAAPVPAPPDVDGHASRQPAAGTPRLTVRELEVLGLYASGEKADRVARLLGISRETVLDHVRRIRQKYAAVHRPAYTKVDLYRRAVEDGVLRGWW